MPVITAILVCLLFFILEYFKVPEPQRQILSSAVLTILNQGEKKTEKEDKVKEDGGKENDCKDNSRSRSENTKCGKCCSSCCEKCCCSSCNNRCRSCHTNCCCNTGSRKTVIIIPERAPETVTKRNHPKGDAAEFQGKEKVEEDVFRKKTPGCEGQRKETTAKGEESGPGKNTRRRRRTREGSFRKGVEKNREDAVPGGAISDASSAIRERSRRRGRGEGERSREDFQNVPDSTKNKKEKVTFSEIAKKSRHCHKNYYKKK